MHAVCIWWWCACGVRVVMMYMWCAHGVNVVVVMSYVMLIKDCIILLLLTLSSLITLSPSSIGFMMT